MVSEKEVASIEDYRPAQFAVATNKWPMMDIKRTAEYLELVFGRIDNFLDNGDFHVAKVYGNEIASHMEQRCHLIKLLANQNNLMHGIKT